MRLAKVAFFSCLLLSGHFIQGVLAEPKHDYRNNFSKQFQIIQAQDDLKSVKILAEHQVKQVIAGEENAYKFAWGVLKNITFASAKDSIGSYGYIAAATPGIIKAACYAFQVCGVTTLSGLLLALGVPAVAVTGAVPVVLVSLLISKLFKNTGNITTEHVKGVTSYLAGTCYHGRNCGQSCAMQWPPQDDLDKACYYHDVCLAKYYGPRWHCDEELRLFGNYIRDSNPALSVKAGVVSDAMAHVLTKMTDDTPKATADDDLFDF